MFRLGKRISSMKYPGLSATAVSATLFLVLVLGGQVPSLGRRLERGHAVKCPDTQTLERLLDGALSPAEYAAVEAHVETCPFCPETLRILTAGRGPGLAPLSGAYTLTLPPGTPVGGKYVIRRHIDRGGQGDVYEAWQQDLERRVAVKMLFSEGRGRADPAHNEA